MDKPFFIMLYHPPGTPTPITGEDDNVFYFESFMAAKTLADDHHACQHFGFEIFEIGTGDF
jgi:hypothetical protein